jgi:hypothetical protein
MKLMPYTNGATPPQPHNPTPITPGDVLDYLPSGLVEGGALADQIVDRAIATLQRAFPGSSAAYWEVHLANFRQCLVEDLGFTLRDLVAIDDVGHAVEAALDDAL